jgi:hypothetical protein
VFFLSKFFLSFLTGNFVVSEESKSDRRKARRSKLFVSAKILQEQGPQPRKNVLGSISGKNVFCTSETDDGRRTYVRHAMFVSVRME